MRAISATAFDVTVAFQVVTGLAMPANFPYQTALQGLVDSLGTERAMRLLNACSGTRVRPNAPREKEDIARAVAADFRVPADAAAKLQQLAGVA